MRIRRRILVQQAVSPRQSMHLQLPLKIPDLRLVSEDIIRAGQKLQPDCVQVQSPQPEHPLQRNGKISAPFTIFRCEAAPEEDCHASRMARLLALSRRSFAILEDLAVRQMRSAMVLVALA